MHPVLEIIFLSLVIELKNSGLPTRQNSETIYSSHILAMKMYIL
jgi:hypothetical protein